MVRNYKELTTDIRYFDYHQYAEIRLTVKQIVKHIVMLILSVRFIYWLDLALCCRV